MKKILILFGFLSLILGIIGIILPIIPTTPFFLLTFICFLKSSDKLHNWFMNTSLYKNNLKDYIEKKEMTKKSKIKITISLTIIFMIGFFIMFIKKIYIPCIILLIIYAIHLIFIIKVKLKK